MRRTKYRVLLPELGFGTALKLLLVAPHHSLLSVTALLPLLAGYQQHSHKENKYSRFKFKSLCV